MRHSFLSVPIALPIALAVAWSVACGLSSGGSGASAAIEIDGGGPSASDTSSEETADADDIGMPNASGVGAGTGADTGLPCDVQQLLENRCIGCHASASPPPLLTYANLVAMSISDPTKTLAQVSLERMKDATRPMPPAPAVPPDASEIATMEAWVAAATPMSAACTSTPDGGANPSPEASAGPPDPPSMCTSNTQWLGGDKGSPEMRPGGACQTCHQERGGPRFDVAGTVYPTAHEPNDCNGTGGPPSLTIIVTDKKNSVTTIPVSAMGNFYTNKKIAAPFSVAITDGTRTRAMAGTLTAGDCNSCHTEAGANVAPGRVMAP